MTGGKQHIQETHTKKISIFYSSISDVRMISAPDELCLVFCDDSKREKFKPTDPVSIVRLLMTTVASAMATACTSAAAGGRFPKTMETKLPSSRFSSGVCMCHVAPQ